MKTAKNWLLSALLLMLGGSLLSAQPMMQLEEGRHNDLMTIRLTCLNKKMTTISLFDINGKPWLEKQVWKKDNYVAGLNISALPDGDYFITVDNQRERLVKVFHRDDYDLTFFYPAGIERPAADNKKLISNREEAQVIARINPAGKKSILLQLANLREEPVVVAVIRTNGIPVYSDRAQGANGYVKKIDLSGAVEGSYLLYVKAADQTLIQCLDLNEKTVQLKELWNRPENPGKGFVVAGRQ